MVNNTIYIITGSTGEYSDRIEWPVAAYTYKDTAKQKVVELNALAREVWKEIEASDEFDTLIGKALKEIDPKVSIDYHTGVSYYLEEVELHET